MTLLAAKVDLKAHQWLLEWERDERTLYWVFTDILAVLFGSFLGPANKEGEQFILSLFDACYGRPHTF